MASETQIVISPPEGVTGTQEVVTDCRDGQAISPPDEAQQSHNNSYEILRALSLTAGVAGVSHSQIPSDMTLATLP